LLSIELPREFVLKSNQGSGGMALVSLIAPSANTLPKKFKKVDWEKYLVHPDRFSLNSAAKLVDVWMTQNYFYRIGHFPEWAYKNIKPIVLIEELMYDDSGQLPADYKFFMVYGKCEFIQVDNSRFEKHTRDLFDSKWSRLEIVNVYPNSKETILRPEHLEEMLRIAERLSSELDFVRVDLYQTSNGVKFGELTNYPGGGMEEYHPAEYGKSLGLKWKPNYQKVD